MGSAGSACVTFPCFLPAAKQVNGDPTAELESLTDAWNLPCDWQDLQMILPIIVK